MNWELKFLSWWSKKGGLFLLFTSFALFLFVTFFGSYPQWQNEKRVNELNEYFAGLSPAANVQFFNLHFEGMFYITLKKTEEATKPENHQSLTKDYKTQLMKIVCNTEFFVESLYSGRKISIDLRVPYSTGVTRNVNLLIEYDECYT